MSTIICNLNISSGIFVKLNWRIFCFVGFKIFQMENVVLFANNSQFMRAEKERKAAISTSSI